VLWNRHNTDLRVNRALYDQCNLIVPRHTYIIVPKEAQFIVFNFKAFLSYLRKYCESLSGNFFTHSKFWQDVFKFFIVNHIVTWNKKINIKFVKFAKNTENLKYCCLKRLKGECGFIKEVIQIKKLFLVVICESAK
jgi:hypothetical protein